MVSGSLILIFLISLAYYTESPGILRYFLQLSLPSDQRNVHLSTHHRSRVRVVCCSCVAGELTSLSVVIEFWIVIELYLKELTK
jgi:hypothetical protein